MKGKAGNSPGVESASRKSARSLPAVNMPPVPENTKAPIVGSSSALCKASVAARYMAPQSAFFLLFRSVECHAKDRARAFDFYKGGIGLHDALLTKHTSACVH